MHIFYDGYVYSIQARGGISRYCTNLINRLPISVIPTLTICQRFNTQVYPDHPNLQSFYFPYQKFTFFPKWVSERLETHYFRSVTALSRFDIAHPTFYSLLTRQEFDKYHCPLVVTIHDLIPNFFPDGALYSWLADETRKALLAAQKIICVSENTKKDLLELYSVPESKVTVTYLASEIDASLSHGSEPVPSRPYYLYVGARLGHKNFDGLLAAFAKAVSIRPDIALCVAGPPFNEAEGKLIADFKLAKHVEHYGCVSDHHLAKLYRCSVAFVYPSLYEGFGIPPLEAMSCGTAVVASNSSSLPEVVGDAGLLFDPKSTNELVDQLLLLLDNSTLREHLVSKGYTRAKQFSWDKTVAQTLDVYCSL